MHRLVILESPFSGDVDANRRYLDACLADSLRRGESPYASHKLLTDTLDDTDPVQREQGMTAGFAWHKVAEASVVYTDRGISRGMRRGIEHARALGLPVEFRQLGHK